MEESGGFKKIEFQNNNRYNYNNKKISPKNSMKNRKLKKILLVAGIFLVLLAAFTTYMFFKAREVYGNAQAVSSQAKMAYNAIKQQNVILAKEELLKTEGEIENLKKSMNAFSFVKYVPLANFYYNDANHLINASSYGVSAGITITDSLIPYADVLGLKGEKSFVAGSAEDRIQTAVKTLGKIVPNIDEIEISLEKAKAEIDQVESNHYPEIWKIKKVRENIEMVKNLTSESVLAIEEAKPLIKVLPELLGEPDTKKYLVLFQNDKEIRSTGGFITFYSVFRVEHGVIKIDTASDIYNLDNSISSHPVAPEVILTYLPKVRTFNIRDSNISPDFVESMKLFNNLYDKASAKTKVDGIIAIDTNVLVHFLDILGDVQVAGVNFSSKNDPRCNCPQVVYTLEAYTTTQVGHVIENRKSIIGELLYAIMGKALSSSPKEYWGKLFQQALKDAQEKHILFYLYNKDAQSGIEALNMGGRIKEFEGDYLHINENNYGGAKSNMFTKESVKVEYETDKDRNVIKTVTVDYKNPYEPSNCNLEQKEVLCLNAILRNYIRLYTPKGSVLVDSKGSEVKVGEKEDLEKTVFDAFLTVRPLGKSQITFKYKLPFKLEKDSPLPVLIQKQPGTVDVSYEIYVNGKKKESFNLNQDKLLNLTGF